jgi:hypothetical protein
MNRNATFILTAGFEGNDGTIQIFFSFELDLGHNAPGGIAEEKIFFHDGKGDVDDRVEKMDADFLGLLACPKMEWQKKGILDRFFPLDDFSVKKPGFLYRNLLFANFDNREIIGLGQIAKRLLVYQIDFFLIELTVFIFVELFQNGGAEHAVENPGDLGANKAGVVKNSLQGVVDENMGVPKTGLWQ